MCDGGCTHTPCRTHMFLALFQCVTYRHRVHAWLKVFAVCMSYLSISPSPFSCFIRHPCCSRTVTSTPRSGLHLPCRTVADPKARVKHTSARAARSLATWPIPRTPHQFYKTETGCKAGDKCLFPHHKVDEQPNKKPKKGYYSHKRIESDDKNAVAIVKIVPRLGLRLARLESISFVKEENSPGETRCKKSWDMFEEYDSLSLQRQASVQERTID